MIFIWKSIFKYSNDSKKKRSIIATITDKQANKFILVKHSKTYNVLFIRH